MTEVTREHDQIYGTNSSNIDDAHHRPGTPQDPQLIISSNLALAVEYEERKRALSRLMDGLPPPPRRKSRPRTGRSDEDSPQSSREFISGSLPSSPLYSTGSPSPKSMTAAPSNPYINPTPRLSYLMRTETEGDAQPAGDPSREDEFVGARNERHRTSTSADGHTMPLVVTSFSPTEASGSPTEAQKAISRHHRYLSSLQKVERLLGKGKGKGKSSTTAVPSPDDRSSPRTSDVSQTGSPQERPSKEALFRRMLERGSLGVKGGQSASAPTSPTGPLMNDIRAAAATTTAATSPSTATAATVAALPSMSSSSQPRTRHSHARNKSSLTSNGDMTSPSSDFNSSSFSPTSHVHRISISSTIYPSTNSNSHSFDNAHYRSFSRSSMDADRESFIDMTSPTSPLPNSNFSSRGSSFNHHTSPSSNLHVPSANEFHSMEASVPSLKPRLPRLATNTASVKPPVPTTPKPQFGRSKSAQPHKRTSPSHETKLTPSPPYASIADVDSLPPTTNLLKPWERADRVRKTRKLTQLFGQTPGVPLAGQQELEFDMVNGCMPMPAPLNLNLAKRKQHRPAISMFEDVASPAPKPTHWPPPEGTYHISIGDRRFSSPSTITRDSYATSRLSLDSASVIEIGRNTAKVIEVGTEEGGPQSDWDSHLGHMSKKEGGAESPTSFIDLSDEDTHTDDVSETSTAQMPKPARRLGHAFSGSSSSASLAEAYTAEQQAEHERRRKREKLAKLHRFLGSRVPAHLVIGPIEGDPLPPPAPLSSHDNMTDDFETRRPRALRRRSSSAAEFSNSWSDDIDRLKDELNEREKAINVRRAVKMEKMFGVAPPQTLYHTRPTPGNTSQLQPAPSGRSSSPFAYRPLPSGPRSPTRNINQAPYKGKSRKKSKDNRPGTSESSKPLVVSSADEYQADGKYTLSDVYLHYQHSLNSLNDIIDRDDRESLAELHDYISSRRGDNSYAYLDNSQDDDDVTVASPTRLERRRSLPSRTSMVSISSEYSLAGLVPPSLQEEESTFQVRRRRAAKLTSFFGVNYRELMSDVLESIEKGLEEESGRGTLKPDEIQDLVQRLGNLKTKRSSLNVMI